MLYLSTEIPYPYICQKTIKEPAPVIYSKLLFYPSLQDILSGHTDHLPVCLFVFWQNYPYSLCLLIILFSFLFCEFWLKCHLHILYKTGYFSRPTGLLLNDDTEIQSRIISWHICMTYRRKIYSITFSSVYTRQYIFILLKIVL